MLKIRLSMGGVRKDPFIKLLLLTADFQETEGLLKN